MVASPSRVGAGPEGCHNRGVPVPSPHALVALTAGADTNGPGYDLVLLAHVGTALVGLVAVGVAGGSALALRRSLAAGRPPNEAVERYYRPGVNWAGRVLFAVPVLGVALLAMSGGRWSFADTWVSIGMAAWAVVAVVAEAVLWPAERRLQEIVASVGPAGGGQPAGTGSPGGDTPDPAALCLRVGVLGLGSGAVLIAVGVLMVAKP